MEKSTQKHTEHLEENQRDVQLTMAAHGGETMALVEHRDALQSLNAKIHVWG